jgi:hypothetical protein
MNLLLLIFSLHIFRRAILDKEYSQRLFAMAGSLAFLIGLAMGFVGSEIGKYFIVTGLFFVVAQYYFLIIWMLQRKK